MVGIRHKRRPPPCSLGAPTHPSASLKNVYPVIWRSVLPDNRQRLTGSTSPAVSLTSSASHQPPHLMMAIVHAATTGSECEDVRQRVIQTGPATLGCPRNPQIGMLAKHLTPTRWGSWRVNDFPPPSIAPRASSVTRIQYGSRRDHWAELPTVLCERVAVWVCHYHSA